MSRLGQNDVGHEGVITRRDTFSFRSSTCSLQSLIHDANLQDVAQLERIINLYTRKMSSTTFDDEPFFSRVIYV